MNLTQKGLFMKSIYTILPRKDFSNFDDGPDIIIS